MADEATTSPEHDEPAGYEPEPDAPWEAAEEAYEEPYEEAPAPAYEEPAYQEPAYEEVYDDSPEAYGWQPMAEPAVFPTAGAIVAIVALAVLAYARLDGVIASLDFDGFSRGVIRALAAELGTILLGGALLVSGLAANRLTAGSKAALVIVGGLILLGGPFIAL